MSENVTALKFEDEPEFKDGAEKAEGVGLGTTMVFQIGREDKFELQTILDRDASLEQWSATLDKMRKAGERQKCITAIQQLEANLREQGRQLVDTRDEAMLLEDNHQAATAARTAQIEQLNAALNDFIITDKSSFDANERKRGEYKPGTSASQRIAAFEREIAKLQDDQKQAEIDRENAHKSMKAQAISFKKQADFCIGEIARYKAELEG